jgi:hypothetical protein
MAGRLSGAGSTPAMAKRSSSRSRAISANVKCAPTFQILS